MLRGDPWELSAALSVAGVGVGSGVVVRAGSGAGRAADGAMIEETKRRQEVPWQRKVTDGIGIRPPALQNSCDMDPETPVSA